MSSTTASRKTTTKPKPGSAKSTSGNLNFDEMSLRLFEPSREKREYDLEVSVCELIEDYGKFLSEKNNGRKVSQNGIVEVLVITALKNHSEFKGWRDKRDAAAPVPTNGNNNGNGAANGKGDVGDDEDEEILSNLEDKSKTSNA